MNIFIPKGDIPDSETLIKEVEDYLGNGNNQDEKEVFVHQLKAILKYRYTTVPLESLNAGYGHYIGISIRILGDNLQLHEVSDLTKMDEKTAETWGKDREKTAPIKPATPEPTTNL